MKFIALSVVILLAGTQDDVEAKKKRMAEVMRELIALGKKIEANPQLGNDPATTGQIQKLTKEGDEILQDLTGGDPKKKRLVLGECIKKYAPELEAELLDATIQANQRNASASLKTICTAQAVFRSNDSDGNLINDYWTGDVAGLCYLVPLAADGKVLPEKDRTMKAAISLIDENVADADAAPQKIESLAKKPAEKPTPKSGYLFVALATKGTGKDAVSTRADTDGEGRFGAVHHLDLFAFATYPSEYGKTGKMTFIANEEFTLWKKDLAGKTITDFPADPAKDGWLKLD